MGSFLGKQVQNSDKNTEVDPCTETKYLGFDKMFVGCQHGYLYEFSIIENKIVHNLDTTLNDAITLMDKTLDNKTQFVGFRNGGFKEFDIPTRKQVNSIPVKNARICVVTHNNKYLITATIGTNCNLTKWSVRTKKELHTWRHGVYWDVYSQSCSYDNKYQLIGHGLGWVGIFDLQKNITLQEIEVLDNRIYSVVFSRDNQSAFISDSDGNIKMIRWKAGANSEDEFDYNEKPKKVGSKAIFSMCLTSDEKYLLVGSKVVSAFETATREVTKQFIRTDSVKAISLIQDGKCALIAEMNGNLSIIDLETLEIEDISKSITNDKSLTSIAII